MEGISGEILNNRQVCDEYSYDGCGALTKDKNKGIYQITYDFNGMPTCVWFDNGSITDYVYTFDGVKLKTVHRTAVDGTTASGSTPQLSEQNTLSKDSTLYVGAMEVRNGRIERYHFSNGYMDISQGQLSSYNYYAKDYLGNVRHVERTAPGTNNQIVQVVNYYPFGGLLNDGPSSLDVQNKLYNGKELDRMHGLNWYDYGARQYDAAICQFTTKDPLCEKYYHISPYAYCHDNPMNRIDPDGRDDFEVGQEGGLTLIKLRDGKEKDIIKYGKESISIEHGVFGKTTKEMINKIDFSKKTATFHNVKDGLEFMRFVSKCTEKELSGVGISNNGSNKVKRLELSPWKENGMVKKSDGREANQSRTTYPPKGGERIKYAIHTHPKVSGQPSSGRGIASLQDRNSRGILPNGTRHFITTPSNNKTYEFTNSINGETKEILYENGLLY